MEGSTVTCQSCYKEMPEGTLVCDRCGTALITNPPKETGKDKRNALVLHDRRTGKEIIVRQDLIIGRGNSGTLPEGLFTENPHVSAPHCEIVKDGGEWLIKDLGSLNKTAVDGVVLEPNVPVRLMVGKKLRIADLYFVVDRQEDDSDSQNETGIENQTVKIGSFNREEKEQYYVKCPECGWEMVLDSPDAKVPACEKCGDVDSVPFIRPLKRMGN